MEHIKRLIILGDNILDTVNSAVQCENYRTLSHDIREQANFFFGKETTYTNYSKSYSENDNAETTYFNMKKPASRRVIVVIALMITITVLSTIASVTIGLTGFLLDLMMLVALSALLIFVAFSCIYFLILGMRKLRLIESFERYTKIVGPEEYYGIKELSEYAGERYEQTLETLHKMIDDGMLPYAKFDDDFKTLILTDRMYSRYSYIKMYGNSFDVTVDDKEDKHQAEMAEAIRSDGEIFLKDVDICKNLAGDDFDIKTEHFNRILEKIFNYLENMPCCAKHLHVLMSSYIEAMRKLLFAYTNLSKDERSNTWSIKLEISEAIDEINDVFETNIDKAYI